MFCCPNQRGEDLRMFERLPDNPTQQEQRYQCTKTEQPGRDVRTSPKNQSPTPIDAVPSRVDTVCDGLPSLLEKCLQFLQDKARRRKTVQRRLHAVLLWIGKKAFDDFLIEFRKYDVSMQTFIPFGNFPEQ